MLTDHAVDDASTALEAYRSSDQLSRILDDYAALLDSYKRLKSDYEEEREGRERYKKLAKAAQLAQAQAQNQSQIQTQAQNHVYGLGFGGSRWQQGSSLQTNAFEDASGTVEPHTNGQLSPAAVKDPYAVVLIDGDGYVFDESLLRAGEDGGVLAAERIQSAVRASLRNKGIDGNIDIHIRIYADLVGLSKYLHREGGIVGGHKRSLSDFVSGFNRGHGLIDFADAGGLKTNASFKFRPLLRHHGRDVRCKHVFFAACNDKGYVPDLMEWKGEKERFTMIKTPSLLFAEEFWGLEMGVEDFEGVFWRVDGEEGYYEEEDAAPVPIASAKTAPKKPAPSITTSSQKSSKGTPVRSRSPAVSTRSGSMSGESQKVCRFNKIGKCKYGSGCWMKHDNAPAPSPTRSMATTATSPRMSTTTTMPIHSKKSDQTPKPPSGDLVSHLPRRTDIPQGFIPLNRSGSRLDPYLESPSESMIAQIRIRSEGTKLCNNKHLIGHCANESCTYDHTPISEEMLTALESLSRSMPCPRRGGCRNGSCVFGHVCQKEDCRVRGGREYCKMPPSLHLDDYRADTMELAATHGNHVSVESVGSGSTSSSGFFAGTRRDSIHEKASWRRVDAVEGDLLDIGQSDF